ncbi:MAG TPA: amidohydrolase [Clostridiaceae bacterium]|nr:amidohydrolase [Clostridiaceae bacterium]
MFIDMHVHPDFYEPISGDESTQNLRHESLNIHLNGTAPLEHIFNQMACAELDRLCLLASDYSSFHGRSLVSNEEVASLVKQSEGKFIGFACVDPLREDAEEVLRYAFEKLELRGLKLNLSRLKLYPMDKHLLPLYKICLEYNKPIIFHSGLSMEHDTEMKFSRPLEFEPVAQSYPNLRICLAHFGWPWVQDTAAMMLKYSNVYTDTALLYFDSAREFYQRVFTHDLAITWIDRSLRHQIMFGSNNPRFEQIRMAKALGELGLRESTLELIKSENALVFLGDKEEAVW